MIKTQEALRRFLTDESRSHIRTDIANDPGYGKYTDLGREQANAKNMPDELYKDWDTLDKSGGLERLKNKDITAYCALFYGRFGKFPSQEDFQKIDHALLAVYQGELLNNKRETLGRMSWEDLQKNGLTEQYRNVSPEGYREKFFNYYGKYPVTVH